MSWAVDLSALYRTEIKGFCLGLSLQNLGPNINYLETGESDPLPTGLRIGASVVPIKNSVNTLTLCCDMCNVLHSKNIYEKRTLHYGLDYSLFDMVSFRIENTPRGFTCGFGVHVGNTFSFEIANMEHIYKFPPKYYYLTANLSLPKF